MFWRLRALAFYTVISFVTILFFLIFCIPMQYFGAPDSFRYKVSQAYSYIFIYLIWLLCGIKFKLKGGEKLPKDGKPYLALSNHQSFWENFYMQLIIHEHSWVVKRELFDIFIFGSCLRAVNPIAVDRSNSRSVMQILREGAEKIENGTSLILFPESTRVPVGKYEKYKVSAAKLALNTGVPIVLMAHNAGMVWPKGFWFTRPGTVKVNIIEVISPKQAAKYTARDLTAYIQDKINTEKDKLERRGV